MIDIQTVSIMLASAGALVAMVYYVFQLRNQTKIRQTDLFMRLQSEWRSRELRDSIVALMKLESKDYDEMASKYPMWEGSARSTAVANVGWFFDSVGILLHRKLIDIEIVDDLFGSYIKMLWERLKPIWEARRKEVDPKFRKWFEYLYDEVKKREQQPASKTA